MTSVSFGGCVIIVLSLVGIDAIGQRLFQWLWEKTHPNYRRFVFETHTGRFWYLRGRKGGSLEASELTDQLQNLHDETAKPPRRETSLLRGVQ